MSASARSRTAGIGDERTSFDVTPRKFDPRARGIVRKVVVMNSLRRKEEI